MLDYLSGKTKESPRNEFWYVNDDGQIVAVRWQDWKVVFLENRGEAFGVWREPFTELRVPLLFNLRRDPFEKAQHNSNTYNDWFLDRAFVIVPIQALAGQLPADDEGVSAQPDPGQLQPEQHPEADRGRNGQVIGSALSPIARPRCPHRVVTVQHRCQPRLIAR